MKNLDAGKDSHWNKDSLKIVVLIGIVTWISRYFYSAGFGLYEDDYAYISPAFGITVIQLKNSIAQAVLNLSPQGAPLRLIIPYMASFVGEQFGGLRAIYVIGFLVLVASAFLFYLLLRRVSTKLVPSMIEV